MNELDSLFGVLDLPGPDFLKLYLLTGFILLCATGLVRRFVRGPYDAPRAMPPLDPYDVAYLQGRETRAAEAALAALVKERLLAVSPSDGKVRAAGLLMGATSPVLAGIHAHVARSGAKGVSLRSILTSPPKDVLARPREKLAAYGLLADWGNALAVRAGTSLAMFALAAFGIAKIRVGLERERPVEFLVFLTVLTVLIALVYLFSSPHRSRRGDAVLRDLKDHSAALKATAETGGTLLTGDLALAAALFGVGALTTPGLEDLRAAQQRYVGNTGSSCSGGSSSCGGSSCGGGCGGGGCGGCGG